MQPPGDKRPPTTSHKKKRFPLWARIAVSLLLVLLVLSGSGLWYYETNFASHLQNITGKVATNYTKKGDGITQNIVPNGDILSGKRINILLLGSDTDGKNQAPLAQTDIVVTIDPQTKYVGMLSIPRDLQVITPDVGATKLDESFSYGWQRPGGTPFANAVGLSIATIEQNFGIPIDHYAWVGLDGFVKVIDTAGGVDIDATHPMVDDNYPNDVNNTSGNAYDYKRLYIAPGPQHMNGEQALEYVRTRHADLIGDFGRSARQQQVLNQLKTKLENPDIINKVQDIVKDLDGHVQTDMQLSDIIKLMNFARTIDQNKVDHVVLSAPYSTSIPNSSNFAPVCSQIVPKITQMFDLGDQARCEPQASIGSPYLASTTLPVASSVSTDKTWQLFSQFDQMAQINTTSVQASNGDLFGIHSLLDLMFMVVFESFDAMKV